MREQQCLFSTSLQGVTEVTKCRVVLPAVLHSQNNLSQCIYEPPSETIPTSVCWGHYKGALLAYDTMCSQRLPYACGMAYVRLKSAGNVAALAESLSSSDLPSYWQCRRVALATFAGWRLSKLLTSLLYRLLCGYAAVDKSTRGRLTFIQSSWNTLCGFQPQIRLYTTRLPNLKKGRTQSYHSAWSDHGRGKLERVIESCHQRYRAFTTIPESACSLPLGRHESGAESSIL